MIVRLQCIPPYRCSCGSRQFLYSSHLCHIHSFQCWQARNRKTDEILRWILNDKELPYFCLQHQNNMDSRTEIRVKNLLELSSQIQFLICDHHTQHILLHVTSQKCHPCTKLLSHLVDTFPLSSHFAYRSKIDIVSTMHI